MKELKSLKLVALDIDGPCVMDTFSPVIRLVVHKLGGEYTAEIERNVFSQNRLKAAQFLIAKLNLNIGAEELIGMYFKERAAYEESVEHGINVGLGEFIGLLENLGLRLICYGGLDKNYFEEQLGDLSGRFEDYICTNDFRPGLKEIVQMYAPLPESAFLFIDDVARVAETARQLKLPFVGIPASFDWSFQRSEMERLGAPYIFDSVRDLSDSTIREIDEKAANGFWPT